MAKRGAMLTLDEQKYRQLAKQANQRAVRLERYISANENAPRSGLDLYQYYLKYAYGETRKRFPENPKKLSSEQINQYTVMLSNFLNMELSRAGIVRKYERQYNQYLQEAHENKGMISSQFDKPVIDAISSDKMIRRAQGASKKVLGGEAILTPNEFFAQLGLMYSSKLMKVMDYRSAMKLLQSVQNIDSNKVRSLINNAAEELAQKKKLTYRTLKKRFKNLAES